MPTPLYRRFSAIIAALTLVSLSLAQTANTGFLEGRVQNVAKGDYLNNALVSVENTKLSTLTNEFGEYRLANVPAGEVKITVFYTGLPKETATVTIKPGTHVVKDFDLKGASDVVQLDVYTVSSSREMSQASLAVNEQRFAPNMKVVLAAEQFGEQSENNVAEFLKLMPGVSISYVDQDARNVSLRGLPSYTTMVTMNGNQVASAASSGASRVFEFEQVSINDIARVEINKTLVPDMPAEGIGGTINLITKSAFERSRPSLDFRTYLNFNTTALTLNKTPGPFRDKTYKVRPGYDFTYINPITKNFGITISGSLSDKYNPQYYGDSTWNLNLDKTTGVENPYISSFTYYDGPKSTERAGGRIALDWRFAPHDVLTVGFSEQYYRALIGLRRINLGLGSSPTQITPDFVQGKAQGGSEYMGASQNDKSGTTWTPEFKYRHTGPVWTAEVSGAYSRAGNDYYAAEKGFFSGVGMSEATINPSGQGLVMPTYRFSYGNFIPDVTAVMADGTVGNPYDARTLTLDNASSLRRKSMDLKKTIRAIGERSFDLRFPLRVRFGGDIREAVRDIRETTPSWTFLGPDGKANTADNFAKNYDIFDEPFSAQTPRFGRPHIQWFDVYKIYNLFQQHPDWWYLDPAALHNNLVDKSKYITETISSGFVRFDAEFFRNRLLLTGGWRYQQYKVHTESGEVDNLGKYLTDSDGNLVIDPVTKKPITLPGSPTDLANLTNVERAIIRDSKEGHWYPSINTTYRITENLQLRASFANSINYPELSDILGSTTVSDYTASTRSVNINSPLKPWTAHNYDLALEYFTRNGGSVSVSWWRKEMTGFIATRTSSGDAAAAALDRYGYGALKSLGYQVQEKFNSGYATMDGWEAALNQKLDPWLPKWMGSLDVFFNTSTKAAPAFESGSGIDATLNREINWGGHYHLGRFSTTLKFNHVLEPKALYPKPSDTHKMSYTFTDMDVTFRLTRHLALFASGTNIFGVPTETFVYDGATPDYARRRAHHFYGVQCVAGIKGQF